MLPDEIFKSVESLFNLAPFATNLSYFYFLPELIRIRNTDLDPQSF